MDQDMILTIAVPSRLPSFRCLRHQWAIGSWVRIARVIASIVAIFGTCACTVQLVAPYNSDLQQKASAMQAEVGTWDLAMRSAAGTVTADPRYPDVVSMLNKWHGEADAMLTLAVSNDPGLVNCAAAVTAIHKGIVDSLPVDLRPAAPAAAAAGGNVPAAATGCESVLTSNLGPEIDIIGKVVDPACKLHWINDSYFSAATQNRAGVPKPPAAPQAADQAKVKASCQFEFTARSQTQANAADMGHGVAVSRLLGLLQDIVYVENRKKTGAGSK